MRRHDGGDLDPAIAIAIEIADANRVQPAIGLPDRFRFSQGFEPPPRDLVQRQRPAARQIRADHENRFAIVQRDDARLQVLEHRIVGQPVGQHIAGLGQNLQRRPLDRVAQHAMAIAGGRLGKPGAGDSTASRRGPAMRNRIRWRRRRRGGFQRRHARPTPRQGKPVQPVGRDQDDPPGIWIAPNIHQARNPGDDFRPPIRPGHRREQAQAQESQKNRSRKQAA